MEEKSEGKHDCVLAIIKPASGRRMCLISCRKNVIAKKWEELTLQFHRCILDTDVEDLADGFQAQLAFKRRLSRYNTTIH